MASKIQVRRDSSTNWFNSNPVLSQGEPALEIDTGKLKYGDGSTAWNDLHYFGTDVYTPTGANNTPVGIREISTIKSFTFKTTGHRFVSTTASGTVTDVSSIVIDSATYPEIVYAQESFDNESNFWITVNGGERTYFATVSVSGTVYTLTSEETFSYNTGDTLNIGMWVHGTQAVFPDYLSGNQNASLQHSASTNLIHLDLSDDTGLSNNGVDVNGPLQLVAYPGKNYLVFNQWINPDTRRITDAHDLGEGLWELTFDGAPRSTNMAVATYTVHSATSVVDSSTLYISRTSLPDLVYYDSNVQGSVQKNADSPITITGGYQPFQNQGAELDYNGNWIIPLDSNITCDPGDTITIIFTKTDYARVDYYVPNSRDDSSSFDNNAYCWLNFTTDVPFSAAERGNGVQAGEIRGYCSVFRPADQTHDANPFLIYFNQSINQTFYSAFAGFITSNEGQFGNVRGIMWPDGWSGMGSSNYDGDNATFLVWDAYEAGVFFAQAPWQQGNFIAQDIKVDIAYKATLYISVIEPIENFC